MRITYMSKLKISYDDIISTVDDFFINGTQTLQLQWKKCVDCKGLVHVDSLYGLPTTSTSPPRLN